MLYEIYFIQTLEQTINGSVGWGTKVVNRNRNNYEMCEIQEKNIGGIP